MKYSINPKPKFYVPDLTYDVKDRQQLYWKTANPKELGFNQKILQSGNDYLATQSQIASFLVIKGDQLVWEAYFNGAKKEHAKNIHSASKSILSTLYGIALQKQDIKGLDIPIKKYLNGNKIDWKKTSKKGKEDITIRHLLHLSSGIKWVEDKTENEIQKESNWVEAILDLPLINPPGSKYNYSTADTHLLAAALTNATGQGLQDYAQKHLFEPLNIKPSFWAKDPDGYNSGGCNFFMTPRELGKLGRLFLQKGKWEGKEIVKESWINKVWTKYVQIDPTRGYGYLWHIPETLGKRVYKMWGWGGQYLYILPEDDVAIVVTADTLKIYREMDGDEFIKKYVFPALPNPSLMSQFSKHGTNDSSKNI